MRLALVSSVAVACTLAVLLAGEDERAEAPAAWGGAPVVKPAGPARYRVPARAIRVATARELHAALDRRERSTIVLAPGTYRSSRPFLNPNGHRLLAARRGRSILRAGLSLGGNGGRPGAVVRGLVLDIRDPDRTVEGAAIAVWGTGHDVRILDVKLRGHGVTPAGIAARQPEGLVVRRVVVRRFTDFGILVDANDLDRGVLDDPFSIADADIAGIARRQPGSSEGRAEACLWIGNTGTVRRVRVRSCGWAGLWTGTATEQALVDRLDIDRTPTGVYVEHFTSDSRFRRLRVGRDVRIGLNAEWADPDWDRRPASVGNVIELSRFESELAGVYLDEGTTRTTVMRSSFANQSWAAIGDYRGNDNTYRSNDYSGIDAGAEPLRRDHLSSSRKG